MDSIDARIPPEPSPFALAGYVLGSLLSLAAATMAGGSTLTLAIVLATSKNTQPPVGSVLPLALSPLLMLMSIVVMRSTQRHGYSLPAVGAIVLAAVIWLAAPLAALLIDFGDPFAEVGVDSQIVVAAHRWAQSVFWVYVIVLTMNICCSVLLGLRDRVGRTARIVFLSTAVILALIAIIPAAGNLIFSVA